MPSPLPVVTVEMMLELSEVWEVSVVVLESGGVRRCALAQPTPEMRTTPEMQTAGAAKPAGSPTGTGEWQAPGREMASARLRKRGRWSG